MYLCIRTVLVLRYPQAHDAGGEPCSCPCLFESSHAFESNSAARQLQMLALLAADHPRDCSLWLIFNAQLLDQPVAGFGPFHGRRPVPKPPPLYFRLWCTTRLSRFKALKQPLLGPATPAFVFTPGLSSIVSNIFLMCIFKKASTQ